MRVTVESAERFCGAAAELQRARRSGCLDRLELEMLKSRLDRARRELKEAREDEPGVQIRGYEDE